MIRLPRGRGRLSSAALTPVAIQRRHCAEGRAGELCDRIKQYLAVQASGRQLHRVKYDNFQDSSYLFVFALN